METRMSINEKLFNLQSEVGAISKDKKNPFYSSAYFDINSLIGYLSPMLQKHKLLLIQPIEGNSVVTRIIDIETGDAYESSMTLPNITDPQKMGSAVTYYRRYSLQSLLALQAEDDDANLASKASKKEKPILTPKSERWVGAVHAIAKGETDINQVKKIVTISDKDAERLVTEAMEVANAQ
jgi:hypothetical protein